MTINNWPNTLNKNFFSFLPKPKENTSTVTYISGREVTIQNNTKKIMTYSFKVEFSPAELTTFWTWFNDDLGQKANAFLCSAIGNKAYRFTDVPDPEDTNTNKTILSCSIEEVY